MISFNAGRSSHTAMLHLLRSSALRSSLPFAMARPSGRHTVVFVRLLSSRGINVPTGGNSSHLKGHVTTLSAFWSTLHVLCYSLLSDPTDLTIPSDSHHHHAGEEEEAFLSKLYTNRPA
jgi:hypothetical protein